MTLGQPLRFTPDELENKIVDYFKWVDEENVQRKLRRFEGEKLKPYTITGLCVYLDICRDTLIEYGKRPDYADAVKRAKLKVENYVEEGLLNGSVNAIGGIFNLKNNFGWVDKIDIAANVQPERLNADDVRKQLEHRNKTLDIEGTVMNDDSVKLIKDK